MKYKPESERINTKDMPEPPEGVHMMQVAGYSENVETPKWAGDIVEFTDGTHKISDFISETTAWKFRRIAQALGDEAVEEYRSTDEDGFSKFNPGDWVGGPWVEVVVETTVNPKTSLEESRIKKINRPESAEGMTTTQMRETVRTKAETVAHAPVKSEDIPF